MKCFFGVPGNAIQFNHIGLLKSKVNLFSAPSSYACSGQYTDNTVAVDASSLMHDNTRIIRQYKHQTPPIMKTPVISSLDVPNMTLPQQRRYNSNTALKTKLLVDNFPNIALELDASMNPKDVSLATLDQHSGRRLKWKCQVCSHCFTTSVLARTVLKESCPECRVREHPLLKDVNQKVLGEWHQTKNNIFLDPQEIEATSKERCWWRCGSCSAVFQAKVRDRVAGKGPCPECNRGQFSDFRINKKLIEEFHPTRNGDLTLLKLRPTDQVKVWWLCSGCGHEWETPVALRAGTSVTSKGNSCPACFVQLMDKKERKRRARQQKMATNGGKVNTNGKSVKKEKTAVTKSKSKNKIPTGCYENAVNETNLADFAISKPSTEIDLKARNNVKHVPLPLRSTFAELDDLRFD
eukprot:Tbor_TRINITY_DN4265_c0_g1::TRINITY_DN4265_c0_g1_i1::g.23939::m.23939